MIKTKNISEMLTSLIEEYRFNKNTLSKYLEITEETAVASILDGHSGETARDNREEGGDDVKSSCPL